jgi:hypothetical protein
LWPTKQLKLSWSRNECKPLPQVWVRCGHVSSLDIREAPASAAAAAAGETPSEASVTSAATARVERRDEFLLKPC